MGIGHRVYKVLDPRAPHLRKMAGKLTEELGEPKWIRMSERIAEIMRERKGLEANVDFYSGIILKAIGFPTSMFTVLFALARTVGWVAQWNEMITDPGQKIGRPRQLYVGETKRDFVAINKR